MPVLDDALHLLDRGTAPGKRPAIIMAVLVHVLLALFLIYGIRWQNNAPEAVEVELVRPGPPQPAPPAPNTKPEPKPEVKPEPKPQPRPEPPVKPQVPVKPDIAVKDKIEKKPEPPKYDPMQELLKKETEQQKQRQLSEALAREEANRQSAQSAAARSKSQAGYADKIRGKVRGNLMVPPGATGNPEAEFLVSQLPSGEVIEVKLKKSTGQPALDDAIERAIRKSSPLPMPDRKEDFVRDLRLQFRPLEQTSAN